jgi:hypothetical protein
MLPTIDYANQEQVNAAIYAHRSRHGNAMPRPGKLNRVDYTPAKPHKPSAHDPAVIFSARCDGRTQFVRGYVRADGRKVADYWRKPAVKREWVGTITLAGTREYPLLIA